MARHFQPGTPQCWTALFSQVRKYDESPELRRSATSRFRLKPLQFQLITYRPSISQYFSSTPSVSSLNISHSETSHTSESAREIFATSANDRRRGHQPGIIDAVAVVQQAAGCLADAVPDARTSRHVDEEARRALVVLDDPERFFDRVDNFDSSDNDAAERISAFSGKFRRGRCLSGDRRQRRRVAAIAG